jgi:hypothetical protein
VVFLYFFTLNYYVSILRLHEMSYCLFHKLRKRFMGVAVVSVGAAVISMGAAVVSMGAAVVSG